MKKRMTAMILGAVMVMGALAGCGSAQTSNDQEAAAVSTAEAVQESEAAVESTSEGESQAETSDSADAGKTLVVYYSAQGHTVNFANAIAEELDADLFELTPVEEYTEEDLDWRDENSRVSREHDDESLRDIELVTTEVENWDSYDTVYIGYPIWWGIAAWPVDNFVKNNDFTGKTVIPFTTSSSSGIGESGTILEGYVGTGNWLEGERFQSDEDTANAAEWAASLSK